MIKQRLDLIAEKARAQNVRVQFDAAEETDAPVNGDAEKIAQIFDNLFLNALEAMPGGGRLKVEIERLKNVVRATISDDGAGVEADAREKLFEPFFTTKETGTGLGLAISRDIAEAHGGKILFREDRTEGAAFVVELLC